MQLACGPASQPSLASPVFLKQRPNVGVIPATGARLGRRYCLRLSRWAVITFSPPGRSHSTVLVSIHTLAYSCWCVLAVSGANRLPNLQLGSEASCPSDSGPCVRLKVSVDTTTRQSNPTSRSRPTRQAYLRGAKLMMLYCSVSRKAMQ